MYGGGQQGGWSNNNPFGQPIQGFGAQQLTASQPYQTAPVSRPIGDGMGLDGLDAFASQGFVKPSDKKMGSKEPAMQQPNYSNVPLSRIPAKPLISDNLTPMMPPMQHPPVMVQSIPQYGIYNTMGGPSVGMPMNAPPFSNGMIPNGIGNLYHTNPFEQSHQPPNFNAQQSFHPSYAPPQALNMNGNMPILGPSQAPSIYQPPQFSGQVQASNAQMYTTAPPNSGPMNYRTPPEMNHGYQDPGQSTMQYRSMPVGPPEGQMWNPFGGNSGPNLQQPVQGGQIVMGRDAGTWDPFSEPSHNTMVPGNQATKAPESGWGDLTDADIWGDQVARTGGNKSPASEDEAAWSDDEGGASDSGSPNPSRKDQEETDFQLALRLQREEEERANERVVDSRAIAQTGPSTDKPDGECLARISKRTLIVKAWKTTYFIFELPDLLLLYRSRDDRIYNPKGAMIKKRIEIKHNHTLSPLTRKFYKDYGYLWHFTMEEQMDYGPSVIAKFAYQDKKPLEDLGNRIAEAIRDKRRTRTRLNNYQSYAPRTHSPPPSYIYNAASKGSPGARRAAGGDKYAKWGNIPA